MVVLFDTEKGSKLRCKELMVRFILPAFNPIRPGGGVLFAQPLSTLFANRFWMGVSKSILDGFSS